MTSNPSPGGSQEPPNFSQDPTPADTWKVCAALEYDMRFEGQPRIEATIGPAEAHGVCPRAADAELRVMQLERDIQTERDLCMAVMRVSAQKDAEYEQLQRNCRTAYLIAALLGVALIGVLAAVAWRLA